MNLYNATKIGNIKKVKELLEAGADPDEQYTDGNTALVLASRKAYAEIVKILLEAGANPNLQNKDGHTALMIASMSGWYTTLVKPLLEAGVNLNLQNKYGNTALLLASMEGDIEILKALLEAGANPNLQNIDGNTALMITSMDGDTGILKALLEAGADKTIANQEGKSALTIAREKRYTAIINLLTDESEQSMDNWKGWTRSDSEKLDIIFDEKAADYACCPVCLKFVERSEACMYMKHDCTGLGGFYHRELYAKYKSPEGKIGWCTICGRIAVGHRHYKLGMADGAVPGLGPGNGDPFETDCRNTNGGGGLLEKLARFRRMREFAKELMEYGGQINEHDALTQLVEETWNAPLTRKPILKKILNEEEWNFPHENFPANSVAVANGAAPNAPAREFPRPAPNRNNAALQPIVHPVGMNQVMQDETAEHVIQFRHRKKDGTINNHETSWISQDSLIGLITTRLKNFGDESAISCWEYPSCNALLYPEEIKGLVPDELYERYKTMFNQQMAVREGGQGGGRRKTRKVHRNQRGGQEDFFKEATNAVCVIVKKPVKGGRRQTRKRGHRRMKSQTHKRRQ